MVPGGGSPYSPAMADEESGARMDGEGFEEPPEALRSRWLRRKTWIRVLWILLLGLCVDRAVDRALKGHVDYYFWRRAAEDLRVHGEVDRFGELPWYPPFTVVVLAAWAGWEPTPDFDIPPDLIQEQAAYLEELRRPREADGAGRLTSPTVDPFQAWRLANPYPRDAADRRVGVFFVVVELLLFLAILRGLMGFLGIAPRWWWAVLGVPVLAVAFPLYRQFRANQLTLLSLALLLWTFRLLDRERPWRAGFVLGMAVAFKIHAVLLLPWLLLKRRFRALGGVLLALTVVFATDLSWLGTDGVAREYSRWFDGMSRGTSSHFIRSGEECDHRNQGLGVTLRRWLHPTNVEKTVTAMPHIDAPPDRERSIHMAEWPLDRIVTLERILLGLSALLGLLLIRRPWGQLSREQRRIEFALVLLGVLWFSSLLRFYYLPLALPALALLYRRVAWPPEPGDRSGGTRKLALLGLGAFFLGQLALAEGDLQAWSPVLWPIPIAGLALAAMHLVDQRSSTSKMP